MPKSALEFDNAAVDFNIVRGIRMTVGFRLQFQR